MADYYKRKGIDTSQLGELARRRQASTAAQQGKLEDFYAEQERQAREDWWSPMAQGTTAGAMFGPWGAGIGALVGGGLGLGRAISGRMDEGEGFWDALGQTITDVDPLLSGKALRSVIPAIGSVAGLANTSGARQAGGATAPRDPTEFQGVTSSDMQRVHSMGMDPTKYFELGRTYR